MDIRVLLVRLGELDLLRAFSTVPSATTCQRRKDSNSPVVRSIETRTSASSVKRFLVAEAIAISSAPNTTSLWTFCSRASAVGLQQQLLAHVTFGIIAWAPVARRSSSAMVECHPVSFEFDSTRSPVTRGRSREDSRPFTGRSQPHRRPRGP